VGTLELNQGINMIKNSFLILPLISLQALSFDGSCDDQLSSPPNKMITPPAGFASLEGVGFSLFADFIYFEARVNNFDYALSGSSTYNDTLALSSQGKTYFPSFNYMPGFKVGMDVALGHDNWDLMLDYMWLNGDGDKSETFATYEKSTLEETRGFFFEKDPTSRMTEADGNFGYLLNFFNLSLGRDFFISNYLTLRPFMGLSGGFDRTDTLVHYTFSDDDTEATGDFIAQYYKQRFWGVGFNAGLNTAWCFNDSWSIFGDLKFMNLWSNYTSTFKERNYPIVDSLVEYTSETVPANIKGSQYGIQNVIDLQMGIRFKMRFNDDQMGFQCQLGWEQQLWINHVQSPVANGTSNLSIQGLDLRARFDF
jgi:hypothetical protein